MAASPAYILEDQRRMTRARNYFEWQARLVLPHLGQRVVEIGAGIGNFTRHLLDRECVIAVESDRACLDLLSKTFPSVSAELRDIEHDSISDLARYRPESCLFINVLEHIEDDSAALAKAASIVEPGGTIVLFVPAFEALKDPLIGSLATIAAIRAHPSPRLPNRSDWKSRSSATST